MARAKQNVLKRALKSVHKKGRRAKGRIISSYAHIGGARFRTAKESARREWSRNFVERFPETSISVKKAGKFDIQIAVADYEADYCVALVQKNKKIGEVKLGFSRNAVVIEAIQGKRDEVENVRKLRKDHMTWANLIVKKVEEHSKSLGFKYVKIRVPESLYHYHYIYPGKEKKQSRNVQERMETLYNNIAKALGYKRMLRFYVKKL